MRLTRETLMKVARDAASQRVRVSRRIICIYLTGSLLGESPMLGGTTDIDLVIVHDSEPIQPREVVRLSDDVHLDISHYAQAVFHHPRHLRNDPWLGPFIYNKPLVLHDTQHWFDFTMAATGAQFFQPEFVLQRANTLAQLARQTWLDLEMNPGASHPERVQEYLKVVENAGNALVSLTGEPIAERRFFLQLPQRLQPLNRPEMTAGLVHLLAEDSAQVEAAWPGWLNQWKEAYQAASSQAGAPPRLDACRMGYYERAAEAMWEENPTAAMWVLMRSWTLAASLLPGDAEVLAGWHSACQALRLDEAHFPNRLQDMDRYLDRMEETIDAWANDNGVSSTAER